MATIRRKRAILYITFIGLLVLVSMLAYSAMFHPSLLFRHGYFNQLGRLISHPPTKTPTTLTHHAAIDRPHPPSHPTSPERASEPKVQVKVVTSFPQQEVKGMTSYHPDVKVVSSFLDPGVKLAYEDCVGLPTSPKKGVRICLNPVNDDRHVSGSLKRGALWESNLIGEMNHILTKEPQLQVVDLGCNIGEYTLWAAAMGRPVLAVEMLESNIRLVQKSLELSELSSLVTLVNNAVYSDHRQLKTLFLKGNLGGTRLNTSSNDDPAASVDRSRAAVTVNTICLDDLLPLINHSRPVYMKIDVENSEHKALAGAHKFFQELDVRYVQMEWLARRPEEIRDITAFMAKHDYVPSRSLVSPLYVNVNVSTIAGHDVYFIKRKYAPGLKGLKS